MKVQIANILKSEIAIFHEEGLQVYAVLRNALRNAQPVIVDFEGLRRCTTQFLNSSIGKLYLEFTKEEIENLLSFNYPQNSIFSNKVEDIKWKALHTDVYNTIVEQATC